MNASLLDTGGMLGVVSQFTLLADARKGRRPSFVAAARPEDAEPLVDAVVRAAQGLGVTVVTGRFRAHMEVALVNDQKRVLIHSTCRLRNATAVALDVRVCEPHGDGESVSWLLWSSSPVCRRLVPRASRSGISSRTRPATTARSFRSMAWSRGAARS